MSKHNKPYHNYNNYSANKPAVEPTEVVENEEMEAVAETVEPTTEVTEEVEAEIAAEDLVEEITVEEPAAPVIPTTPAPTMGVVNCAKLRMRNAANTEADVIYNLPEGTEVEVNFLESTEDFYNVTIETGAVGFCMKKFITIK